MNCQEKSVQENQNGLHLIFEVTRGSFEYSGIMGLDYVRENSTNA